MFSYFWLIGFKPCQGEQGSPVTTEFLKKINIFYLHTQLSKSGSGEEKQTFFIMALLTLHICAMYMYVHVYNSIMFVLWPISCWLSLTSSQSRKGNVYCIYFRFSATTYLCIIEIIKMHKHGKKTLDISIVSQLIAFGQHRVQKMKSQLYLNLFFWYEYCLSLVYLFDV